MTPNTLLDHLDQGLLWPAPSGLSLDDAYAQALAVRRLRIARGEQPRGYKVGFTNRSIWPRYNVFAPIWGSVWDSTLTLCEGEGSVSLAHTCQPRLEPEVVFGLKATPAPDATLDDLFAAIDWVAPGFEVVQSHLPDWKFVPPDTVADGALHARLLVGRRTPVRELARSAATLDTLLAQARVSLLKHARAVEEGQGSNVLDSPLRALQHFTQTLRACPGAPDLQAGDVITTGTWTDAWPVAPGEHWSARFTSPLPSLSVHFAA
ncbi:2-keto-4-pentenoate hydratase [Hydrogenophaga sp. PBL-H3]|uniref:2-keto-4-pentenoate hydratase n=1 Tax=Hydrogenophaga sp. PBL-H3 TaxID=434010 RepID=UPI00131FADDA|nr:fumarylacetoacetate hydrolase family protein [Hydrogenophaga sp. PBL-H3]QHE77423.1 hydratase [Hydrogenophaga sp. PBL-H3]QHE81847.1 hydratase [Hydrogenophaga sp. PBL-H3]